MDGKNKFFAVFYCCPKGSPYEGPLSEAEVTRLDIDSEKRVIKVTLSFHAEPEYSCLAEAEAALRKAYALETAEITPAFPGLEFGEDAAEHVLGLVRYRYPSLGGFICEQGWSIENGVFSLNLKNGGMLLAERLGAAREIRQYIESAYENAPGFVISEPEGGAGEKSIEEQLREEMNRAIIEAHAVRTESAAASPKKKKPAEPDKNGFKRPKAKPARKTDEQDILFGKPFGDDFIPMSEINRETAYAAVLGEIFALETREISNGTKTVVSFDAADDTGAVRVKRIFSKEEADEFLSKIKTGLYVAVRGEVTYDRYENDIVMKPTGITRSSKREKEDLASKKRVELHLHTQMSTMDGVSKVSALVARAAKWGHPAVAITDHGVTQGFPEAMHAAMEHDIKIIYGTEGYYINNLEDVSVVTGPGSGPLDGEIVCFDLETTGIKPDTERITEIAASVLKDGRIIDNFHTYANPGIPIPPNITELTGITDAMVAKAPLQEEALRAFLSFARGRVMAAHNASFDASFVTAGCAREGIPCGELTYIDTLEMSRILMPELERHRLNNVAEALKLPKFRHHSAGDDAKALALILAKLAEKAAAELGVSDIGGLNAAMSERRRKNAEKSRNAKSLPVRHIILLARNLTGLKNLYKLVSWSHLNGMNRRKQPVIPRNILARHRDGLLVGSACEAGELYSAITAGAEWKELKRIAEFYDFFEIQPIGNNAFMLRNGFVSSEEDIKNYNRTVVRLGEALKKPVVATGDVHFLDPKDEVFRRIIMAGKGFEDADNQAPLYLRTTEEMLAEFEYLGEDKAYEVVVENTNLICDMCEKIKPVPDEMFPPEMPGSAAELENLVRSRAERLYGDPLPEIVRSAVDRELGSIIKHGFDVMYMIAQKLIARSNECGYLVGSRGSVGSSIAAYFAGITEVNALPPHYLCPECKYSEFHKNEQWGCGPDLPDKDCPRCGTRMKKDGFDIPFETFLGFDGDKAPDIDLNFSGEYQARAHRHTIEMFGEDNVFRAGTIGTLAEKTALGFVRKYNEERGIIIPKAEENRLVQGCTGVKRTTGQHPGGLVVVPHTKEIYDFCPVQHPADDLLTDIITTHVDYHSIDSNLLKLDLLGHDDPTMIKMLEDLTGVNALEIPLDDRDTLSLYSSCEALGIEPDEILGETGAVAIPEYGTKFVRQMLLDTLPTTVDELVRIAGLSHGENVWLNNSQELVRTGTATLKECICCRDDIMQYLIKMGLTPKLAFTIMESVRKGKRLKPEWETEMRAHDVPEWYIKSCNLINYMFPKAHAAAYVMSGFRIAWFKVHRPLAFYSAYFSLRAAAIDAVVMIAGDAVVCAKIHEIENNNEATANENDLKNTLEVCHEFYKRSFGFLSVDIYLSHETRFLIEDGALRMPLTAIKGLGESAAQSIVAERETGEFLSVEELQQRCQRVSKTVVEALRQSGALGSMPETSQITLFEQSAI